MNRTGKLLLAVAAVVGGAAAVVAVNVARFRGRVRREATAVWDAAGAGEAPLPTAVETLPPPVRGYARQIAAAGRPPVRTVRLVHGGSFRTELGGRWWLARGTEWFSAAPPAFVWWGRVRMAPGVWFDARDRSARGVGSMYVKLASTVTILDSAGPGIDQGALVRLLGEMLWFPSALFDPRWVTWSPADARSARATIHVDGHEASCTFEFDDRGLPVSVSTERFRDTREGPVLTPWSVRNEDFRNVDGYPVPHRSVVSWHVDGAARSYADFRVERIEYDLAEPM